MNIRFFKPAAPLLPHIAMIWAFEQSADISLDDARLIAPNGCMKLLLPYRKSVTSFIGTEVNAHPAMSCIIAGQMRLPVTIASEPGGGTIGIEFRPSSSRLFFRDGLDRFTDRVYGGQEVWGALHAELQERLDQGERVEDKVDVLQQFLIRRIANRIWSRTMPSVRS